MRKEIELELKVGLFVSIGLSLVMLAILTLGGAKSLFSRQNEYTLHFDSAEGLITGAKVVLGGLTVGAVDKVDLDPDSRDIEVTITMDRKYGQWVRKGTEGEIATQGLLGDKYIALTLGREEAPALEDGSEIPVRNSKDLTQFLSKGDQLLVSLNSIAGSLDRLLKQFESENRSEKFFDGLSSAATNLSQVSSKLNQQLTGIELKQASQNLNSILKKINDGTGTLGALVNDPGLYDDIKALTGGANRNRVMRNLVRKTIKDGEKEQVEGQAGGKER